MSHVYPRVAHVFLWETQISRLVLMRLPFTDPAQEPWSKRHAQCGAVHTR
jgi:hypothetical protein